jgi:hypothetical protein
MPRKKSILWKCTFWLLGAMLFCEIVWLASVPTFRQTLKIEREMPRVAWLELPSEIDLLTLRPDVVATENEGPKLSQTNVTNFSAGDRLASISIKSRICWPDLPMVLEPWNIRIEMAVLLSEDDRFLSTARGSMFPNYESKKLTWQNPESCEPVVIKADFFLPPDKEFYGYILRLFYKDKMTSEHSEPAPLSSLFSFNKTSDKTNY